jgi:hypothetical protein
LNAHPGYTAEVINHLVAGDDSYGSSAQVGVYAVINQVNAFYAKCPSTNLVLVRYSQVSNRLSYSAWSSFLKRFTREKYCMVDKVERRVPQSKTMIFAVAVI